MRLPGWADRIFKLAKDVVTDFGNDNGSIVAAAVSFFVFLSIFPLILLAVAIGGFVLGSPQRVQDLIFSAVGSGSPATAMDIRPVIQEVIRGRGSATIFGILALLWSGTSVIVNFEQAINIIWNVERKRSFVAQRLLAVGLLLLMGVLLGLSFGLTAVLAAVRSLDIQIFGVAPAQWPWIWTILGFAVPLVVTILTFTLFYKILPNTNVRWADALISGAFAGILWEIAKYGFSYYAANFSNYNAVYGSLAGIIVLMVWIYISAIITILGAEVGSIHSGRHAQTVENGNA